MKRTAHYKCSALCLHWTQLRFLRLRECVCAQVARGMRERQWSYIIQFSNFSPSLSSPSYSLMRDSEWEFCGQSEHRARRRRRWWNNACWITFGLKCAWVFDQSSYLARWPSGGIITRTLALNGSEGRWPEPVWMGCTVSFICCEDDFLQMPLDQHVEKKKEEKRLLSKVGWCRNN